MPAVAAPDTVGDEQTSRGASGTAQRAPSVARWPGLPRRKSPRPPPRVPTRRSAPRAPRRSRATGVPARSRHVHRISAGHGTIRRALTRTVARRRPLPCRPVCRPSPSLDGPRTRPPATNRCGLRHEVGRPERKQFQMVIQKVLSATLAVSVLGVSRPACGNSNSPSASSTGTTKAVLGSVPTSAPNQVKVRKDFQMLKRYPDAQLWLHEGQRVVGGQYGHEPARARCHYNISVFLTSTEAADFAFASTSVPVTAGRSKL